MYVTKCKQPEERYREQITVCIHTYIEDFKKVSVSESVGLMSHSTHNRSFRRRVFPGNQLHWY